MTAPYCLSILVQLPPPHLESALAAAPELKEPLTNYAHSKSINLKIGQEPQ
jgi:hypothetical protein